MNVKTRTPHYIVLALMVIMGFTLIGLQWSGASADESGAGENSAEIHTQQDNDGPEHADEEDDEFYEDDDDDAYIETLLTVLGVDEETLFTGWDNGQSLAEIAQANGVDPQVVIAALVADENAWIDAAEAAGEISAEEAAEWRGEVVAYITYEVNHAEVDLFQVTADTIGIEIDALWDALDAGKTGAEIATENGVEVQGLIDALVGAESAEIDSLLAADLLTEAEAEEWRSDLVSEMTEIVNEPFDDFEMDECDQDEEWDEEDEHSDEDDDSDEHEEAESDEA